MVGKMQQYPVGLYLEANGRPKRQAYPHITWFGAIFLGEPGLEKYVHDEHAMIKEICYVYWSPCHLTFN